MQKQELRKILKKKHLDIQNKTELENQIIESLIPFLGESKKILSYAADAFEISLNGLERFRLVKNWEIYYPRITESSKKKLSFFYPDFWQTGSYGIQEPIGDKEIHPEDADFCIVPALGFNQKGYRLGRGGGYYDRALAGISFQKMIGIQPNLEFICEFEESLMDIRVGTIFTKDKIFLWK